jgi:hypothetical protein
MKPTIIALIGRGNCGKTKTLIRVLALLEKEPGAKVLEKREITKKDWLAIILIGSTKIGITTEGDPGGQLDISLDYFIEVNCHIIICACRTSGRTMDMLRKLEGSFELHLIRQEYDNESEAQLRIQETKAAEILDLIAQTTSKQAASR